MIVTAFPPSSSLYQYLPGLPRTLALCMLPTFLLTMPSAQACQPLPPQLSVLHCPLCNHALRFLPGTVSVHWRLFRLFPVFRKSFLPVLTSGHHRTVDKPPYIKNLLEYNDIFLVKSIGIIASKKVMVCYAMAFIIRFRFNAVDDKRHCCSAASNPLLYKNLKLCLAFCVAKLPSLHICRRSKTLVCLSDPSFSWFFLTTSSKMFTWILLSVPFSPMHLLWKGQPLHTVLAHRYSFVTVFVVRLSRCRGSSFFPGQIKTSFCSSY